MNNTDICANASRVVIFWVGAGGTRTRADYMCGEYDYCGACGIRSDGMRCYRCGAHIPVTRTAVKAIQKAIKTWRSMDENGKAKMIEGTKGQPTPVVDEPVEWND